MVFHPISMFWSQAKKEPDIEKTLAPLVNLVNFPSISIQTNQVQADIHEDIKSRLANDPELQRWSLSIKEEIQKTSVE